MERHAHWTARYAETARLTSGRYSLEALDTFPRYNVLAAILEEVERWRPEDFTSLEAARELLAEAGRTAASPFTRNPLGEVDARAMADERRRFVEFIRTVSGDVLANVGELPYRRVLLEREERELRDQLRSRWGVEGGYWYPLAKAGRADLVAYDAPAFHRALGGAGLQRMLAGWGVERVWELREHGASYELELRELDPHYTGGEGFWTGPGMEWLLYASHEQSITVAGTRLLAAVRETWPAAEQHVWQPFDD